MLTASTCPYCRNPLTPSPDSADGDLRQCPTCHANLDDGEGWALTGSLPFAELAVRAYSEAAAKWAAQRAAKTAPPPASVETASASSAQLAAAQAAASDQVPPAATIATEPLPAADRPADSAAASGAEAILPPVAVSAAAALSASIEEATEAPKPDAAVASSAEPAVAAGEPAASAAHDNPFAPPEHDFVPDPFAAPEDAQHHVAADDTDAHGIHWEHTPGDHPVAAGAGEETAAPVRLQRATARLKQEEVSASRTVIRAAGIIVFGLLGVVVAYLLMSFLMWLFGGSPNKGAASPSRPAATSAPAKTPTGHESEYFPDFDKMHENDKPAAEEPARKGRKRGS